MSRDYSVESGKSATTLCTASALHLPHIYAPLDTTDSCLCPEILGTSLQSHPIVRKELSRAEWETLKPVIRRAYIDENQSFAKVQQLLTSEHQFTPTKRQFTRRLTAWGFKKNIKKDERDAILKAGCNNKFDSAQVDTKIRRLRKRYGGPQYMRSLQGDSSSSSPSTSAGRVLDAAGSNNQVTSFEGASEALDPRAISDDPWPFDWASVDVPGSPGLTRLFKRLDLECSDDVPPIALNSNFTLMTGENQNKTAKDLTSHNDNPRGFSHPKTFQNFPTLERDCSERIASGLSHELSFFPEDFGLRNKQLAILKSRAIEMRSHWPSISELEDMLDRQEKMDARNNSGVARIMELLGVLNQETGNFVKAESFYRRRLRLFRLCDETTFDEVLGASLSVIWAVSSQGRMSEAYKLLEEIRPEITRYSRDHRHRLLFTKIECGCLNVMGYENEAESSIRELLQIELVADGPWAFSTQYTMRIFQFNLTTRNRANRCYEAENLARISFQFYNAVEDNNQYIDSFRVLLRTSLASGLFGQSLQIAYHIAERTLHEFRRGQFSALGLCLLVDLDLRRYGLLDETAIFCEKLLEGCEEYSRPLDEWQAKLSWELGCTFYDMARHEEGQRWLQKAHDESLILGMSAPQILDACRRLGLCYTTHGLYADAVRMYLVTIKYMKTRSEVLSADIEKLEGFVRICQAQYIDCEAIMVHDISVADNLKSNDEESGLMDDDSTDQESVNNKHSKGSKSSGDGSRDDTLNRVAAGGNDDDDIWAYIDFKEEVQH